MSILTLLMERRFDWYRPAVLVAAGGAPGAPTYSRIYSAIPVHVEAKPSVRSPELLGRLEGENLEAMDLIHVEATTLLQADDWGVDVDPDSSQFGEWWVIRGDQTAFQPLGILAALARNRYMAFNHSTSPVEF